MNFHFESIHPVDELVAKWNPPNEIRRLKYKNALKRIDRQPPQCADTHFPSQTIVCNHRSRHQWTKFFVCLGIILCLAACTAEPDLAVTTVVTRAPAPIATATTLTASSTPSPLSTAMPTQVPTLAPSPEEEEFTATAVPAPASTINLNGISKVAQWGRGEVYDMAYSNDGRSLIITSASGTYIHDIQDPDGIQQKFESDLPVVLSPDGETAVIGQEVRRLEDNELLFTLPIDVLEAKFFLNGELLAVKNWVDGEGLSIQLWSIPNAQLIHTFENTQDITFSPDEKLILATDFIGDFVSYAWPGLAEQQTFSPIDVGSGEMTEYLASNATFSPDGQTVALAWESVNTWNVEANAVEIRDLTSGENLLTIPSIEPWGYKELSFSCDEEPFLIEGPGAPRPIEIRFSPDGQFVAVVYNDDFSASDKAKRRVNIYRVSDGALVQSVDDGNHAAFSPDSQTVTVSTVLGDVQMWSLSDFSLLHNIQGYTSSVRRIQFSPDGQIVAIEYFDKSRLQKINDGTSVAEYPNGRITFAPDGETLAVGYGDGRIEWRQLADNSVLNSFSGHTARVNDLLFLPSGDLVSVADDCTMYAWSIADGTRKLQFENYLRPSEHNSDEQIRIKLNHLLALPSRDMIIGSSGYEINVWQTKDGTLVETLRRNSSSDLFTLPNGEKINRLDNAPNAPLNFWETTNEVLLATVDGMTSFSFSPDGAVLALGADARYTIEERNGVTQLWDAQAGMALRTLPSPDQRKVTAVQFSPDGRYLLVGSAGGLITVWEMPTP